MKTENLDYDTVNETEELSIKDLILKFKEWSLYLLSKWMLILFFGFLGGVLGGVYAFFKQPIYTATSTFVLEEGDKGAGLGQYSGIASMVGIDIGSGGGIFQGDNILELYKSRSMIEKTLLSSLKENKNLLLIDSYISFNELRNKWKKNHLLKDIDFHIASNASFSRLQDSVMGKIVEDINKNYLSVAKPDKKLSIIQVDVRSKNEDFAKNFNDQIVKNVNDFYVQTKTKKSLENVSILQQKVDSVRSVMNGAIYTAAVTVDVTPNLNPTRQAQRAAPIQRSQFSAETNKAILGELVKNLELSKISLRKEAPLIQVIDHPIFPLNNNKLSKVKAIILGGLFAGFMTILFLFLKRVVNTLIS